MTPRTLSQQTPETVALVAEELRLFSAYDTLDRSWSEARSVLRGCDCATVEQSIAFAVCEELYDARQRVAALIEKLAPEELAKRQAAMREDIEDLRADALLARNPDDKAALETEIANLNERLAPAEAVRSMLAASVERLAEGAR